MPDSIVGRDWEFSTLLACLNWFILVIVDFVRLWLGSLFFAAACWFSMIWWFIWPTESTTGMLWSLTNCTTYLAVLNLPVSFWLDIIFAFDAF